MCTVGSRAVRRWCLLWPVHSLGKTLLGFPLLLFVLQGQICLLLQVSLHFLLFHSRPLSWKWHLIWVLVLEDIVGLHWTVQTQLLQHYWLGHGYAITGYGPIWVFFWASCSWWSEGLFGKSFSMAPPVQALSWLPYLGSFSVVWQVRLIEVPLWLESYLLE